jgi:hypothetical protein
VHSGWTPRLRDLAATGNEAGFLAPLGKTSGHNAQKELTPGAAGGLSAGCHGRLVRPCPDIWKHWQQAASGMPGRP